MKNCFFTFCIVVLTLTSGLISCQKEEKKEIKQEINEEEKKDKEQNTEIIKIVKHPSLSELQKNNYTAAGKYFDFKNMKADSVDFDDESKYTFTSDIVFDEEKSSISFEDEYSSYNYVLYFVGDELYRQTGLYKRSDGGKDSTLFGKYTGEDRNTGEVIQINITEDGKFTDTQNYVIDGYKIIVDDFYDYYYDGKNIVTLRNYFTKCIEGY